MFRSLASFFNLKLEKKNLKFEKFTPPLGQVKLVAMGITPEKPKKVEITGFVPNGQL